MARMQRERRGGAGLRSAFWKFRLGSDHRASHRVCADRSLPFAIGRLAVRRCQHRQNTGPAGIACRPLEPYIGQVLRNQPSSSILFNRVWIALARPRPQTLEMRPDF
jgi:hypothetical protein